jgi:hypothetical protein
VFEILVTAHRVSLLAPQANFCRHFRACWGPERHILVLWVLRLPLLLHAPSACSATHKVWTAAGPRLP